MSSREALAELLWAEKYRPRKLSDMVNQEEVVKRLEKFVEEKNMPHLLFAGPPGTGKCVTGDTLVLTSDGVKAIREVVEREIRSYNGAGELFVKPHSNLSVYTLDRSGVVRKTRVSYVYRGKTSSVVIVKTRLGRVLKLTPRHPLLVLGNNGIKWVRASSVKPGDYIATPRIIKIPNGFRDKCSRKAELLGYILSDGNIYYNPDTGKCYVAFHNNDKKLREIVKKLFKEVYGVSVREEYPKGRTPRVRTSVKRVVLDIIRETGVYGRKSSKIHIPPIAWRHKGALRSFLRAYYDGDAYVGRNDIVLSTRSREFAYEIAYALLVFGIRASVRRHRDSYRVYICGRENVEKFVKEIGFNSESKKLKALYIIKSVRDHGTNVDVIPVITPFKDVIRVFREEFRSVSGSELRLLLEKDRVGYRRFKSIGERFLKDFRRVRIKIDRYVRELSSIEILSKEQFMDILNSYTSYSTRAPIYQCGIREYLNNIHTPRLMTISVVDKRIEGFVEDFSRLKRILYVVIKNYIGFNYIAKKLSINPYIIKYMLKSRNNSIDAVEYVKRIRDIVLRVLVILDKALEKTIETIDYMLKSDILWDYVEEVSVEDREETVYDLTIDNTHNYVGGNLPTILHNTTAAHCLAHDLYGEDYHRYMLELNASVSKNTPILVRVNGKVMRVTFDYLDKKYFNKESMIIRYRDGEYVRTPDLEILTYDKETGKVLWKKVKWIIRHKTSKIMRVRIRGGGVLELTGNHSVMVLDSNGEIIEKSAYALKPGDYLISFVTKLPGKTVSIKLRQRRSSRVKLPDRLVLSKDLAWLFGIYVAEGAVGFKKSRTGILTSGQLVITVGYPKEQALAKRIKDIAVQYSIPVYENIGYLGYDRSCASSYQVRLLSTGLSRYVKKEFYSGKGTRAVNKRVPSIIFEGPIEYRVRFLKGLYKGDGTGVWNSVVRISSVSKDLLIDATWLARISGIESLIYDREVRLIWKGSMKYKKSDLLLAKPYIEFFNNIGYAIGINWRYELRHQLYEGRETVSKEKLIKILKSINEDLLSEDQRKKLAKLRILAMSDLHVVKISSIELIDYNDYVYDVYVPDNNMFFAGTIPVLLHNSDERGIDVIRSKVKEFARTRVPGEIPFKIVLLDEADNMTADAQQALRRLMELFTINTRFILIANYPSKIIEPIQSRCAVFRFTPLKKDDVVSRLKWIADQEGVEYDVKALETIHEISEGDMRKAINVLQAASALGKVTVEAVYKVVGLAHPREVREMIKLALDGKFDEARSKLRELMINYGLSGLDIIKQVHREIFSGELKLPDEYRVLIADYAGEIQYRLVEGADDEIQLNAFLARLAFLGRKFKV